MHKRSPNIHLQDGWMRSIPMSGSGNSSTGMILALRSTGRLRCGFFVRSFACAASSTMPRRLPPKSPVSMRRGAPFKTRPFKPPSTQGLPPKAADCAGACTAGRAVLPFGFGHWHVDRLWRHECGGKVDPGRPFGLTHNVSGNCADTVRTPGIRPDGVSCGSPSRPRDTSPPFPRNTNPLALFQISATVRPSLIPRRNPSRRRYRQRKIDLMPLPGSASAHWVGCIAPVRASRRRRAAPESWRWRDLAAVQCLRHASLA